MKTRAEVMREKRERESAAARTVPLPLVPADAAAACKECSWSGAAASCTERPDGLGECPECGAPVELRAAPPAASSAPAPAEKPKADFVDKTPERKWCGDCGAAISSTNIGIFFPCGHVKAERVDDPRKAKKVAPPAGLQTITSKEIERREATDGTAPAEVDATKLLEQDRARLARSAEIHAASPAGGGKAPPKASSSRGAPFAPATGPGAAVLSGNRLSIPWGEARCPVDQFNNFKCGGHIITVDLPEGADRVAAAAKILDDLEKIADLLFERQSAWYLKKLGVLAGGSK